MLTGEKNETLGVMQDVKLGQIRLVVFLSDDLLIKKHSHSHSEYVLPLLPSPGYFTLNPGELYCNITI